MVRLGQDAPPDLLLEYALAAAVEDGAEQHERRQRDDDGAGEHLLVQRDAASRGRHDRPQRAEASEEGRQQRLEVEEREQAADQPSREAEAHDLEDLGGRQLREEPHLHGADPVAGERRDDEHKGDPDGEVEDLPLERGGLRGIDGAGVTEGVVPVPLDGAEPEEREEHRPEAAGHRHLPGVADEHPAELHRVEQPAEQRVREAEAPPRRHGDQRRAEDRAAEVARVRERRGQSGLRYPASFPKCWTMAAASAAAV